MTAPSVSLSPTGRRKQKGGGAARVSRCTGAAFAVLTLTGVCAAAQAPAASFTSTPTSTSTASTSATALSQAAAPQADDAAALVKQARALTQEGKLDEALTQARQLLKTSPDNADAHTIVGVVLDLKGQYAEARKHLQKAIDLAATPDAKAQSQRIMAMSYAFDKNAKQAIAFAGPVFELRLANQDYTGAAEVANELARICLESGAVDDAQTWYTRGYETALKKTDLPADDKDLWNFRWAHAQARIAARRGNKAEAEKQVAAAKAILDKGTLKGQAAFFPYLTGYVAFHGGDMTKAIAELQKGNLKDPFILGLLAQAYEKTGDKAQAMDYYKKVLTFYAHNPTNAFVRPLAQSKVGAS